MENLRNGKVVEMRLGIRNPLEREIFIKIENYVPEIDEKIESEEENEMKQKFELGVDYFEAKKKQRCPPPEVEHSFSYIPPIAPINFLNTIHCQNIF